MPCIKNKKIEETMIFVFTLCVALLILSFILSKYNVLSPGVITSGIWLVCLSLFWILHHDLPALTFQFLGSLSIWVTLLCLSSLLMQSVKTSSGSQDPSIFVRDLFFWIPVITYPAFLMFAYKAIMLGDSGSWSMDLRMASLGKTTHFKEIYGGIHIIIWQVAYLIELFYYSRKNKKNVFILGFMILSFAFLTMSKAAFLDIFIKTICVLYFMKKVTVKHILIGLGSLFFLFAILQSIRYSTSVDSVNKQDFVVQYILSSMSAFDTLEPQSSLHWGENVFRFYYSTIYKLGISSIEPIDTLLPFIQKPIGTNTYTVMYPFFKDFGYWGIVFFAPLLGLLYGWIFNKAQRGNVYYILLFATFVPIILMQYVAEIFITSLFGYLKQIILLSIPFWAAKFKIFNQDKFFKHEHE